MSNLKESPSFNKELNELKELHNVKIDNKNDPKNAIIDNDVVSNWQRMCNSNTNNNVISNVEKEKELIQKPSNDTITETLNNELSYELNDSEIIELIVRLMSCIDPNRVNYIVLAVFTAVLSCLVIIKDKYLTMIIQSIEIGKNIA